jgi:hypothetical protein
MARLKNDTVSIIWQVRIGQDVHLEIQLVNKERQNPAECLNGENYCSTGMRIGQVMGQQKSNTVHANAILIVDGKG